MSGVPLYRRRSDVLSQATSLADARHTRRFEVYSAHPLFCDHADYIDLHATIFFSVSLAAPVLAFLQADSPSTPGGSPL
jgi:hypothetical protein